LKQRKAHNYRVSLLNDDTFKEIGSFRINRVGVLVGICTVFVSLVALVCALLVFSPLRYYIPGYLGNKNDANALRKMKIQVDSLENAMRQQDRFYNDIKKVINTEGIPSFDTTNLVIKQGDSFP
jgi:hypothetical protein